MIYSRSWLSASKWKSIKSRSAGSRNFCPVAYRVLSPLHSTRSIALLINSTGRFFSSSEFFTSVVAAMLLRSCPESRSLVRLRASTRRPRALLRLARFSFFPSFVFSARAHARTRGYAQHSHGHTNARNRHVHGQRYGYAFLRTAESRYVVCLYVCHV